MTRLICTDCLTFDVWADLNQLLSDVSVIPPNSVYCDQCQNYTTHVVTNRVD